MAKKSAPRKINPPLAEKRPHSETWHGHEKHDDYKWLKADNWQAVMHDPTQLPQDIRGYLEAENAYSKAKMAGTAKLQKKLFAELKGRIKEDDQSVPTPDGPFIYSSAFIKGGQYPMLKRAARDGSAEEILFDCNAMAKGHDYFSFGGVTQSADHRRGAWSVDDKGSEYYDIRVRDYALGRDLDDVIKNTSGDALWSQDGEYIFYTLQDENHRPLKTLRHRLGTKQKEDVLVFEETDTGLFTGMGVTQSEKYIIIGVNDHDSSENWFIDADAPLSAPRLIAKRAKDFDYTIDHHGDNFIFKTNADGAEDYKLSVAPVSNPGVENWKDLVPHRPGIFIVTFTTFKNWMIRLERENALPRIVIRNMTSGEEHSIAFEEEAYSLGFGDMREFDTDVMRFSYSSPTTPTQVYDYNMRTRERVLRKTQEVPSGHDPKDYVTRRLLAPAHDGEMIPVTLLYHRTTKLDGTAPLWLYGYGSYGMSLPAAFSTNILPLVDRGFVYATAHVRGGQEKGRRWYKTGKLEHKINTFKDFISAGEFLVAQGLTTKGNIIAEGGSAGGLLVGAVANMAPDLFKAIVAQVPFVDALTTILDDTLPLTPPEWPEWGNPIIDKVAYENLASYAPYENVKARAYPHIFALGGLTDPRVTYWEPAKWMAKLRVLNTSTNDLLLKINMGAGHGGATGRFNRLKEVAEVYAFGLKAVGKVDAS